MGGKGSGGYRGKMPPDDKNPIKQAADPSNVDKAVNAAVMAFGRDLMRFEPPDFSDAGDVQDAFCRYLELCERHGVRPMVTSMANAFGMNRHELYNIAVNDRKAATWRGGVLTPESRAVVQKSYNFLNVAWETYLMSEKGNPVKWLFLGKNYFGMRDQTERIQVNMDATPKLPSPEEVAAKYALQVGRDPKPIEGEVVKVEDA